MQITNIHTTARNLMKMHGTKAIAKAAQKAIEFERSGDTEEARNWRRIETALVQMSGPHMS